MTDVKDVLVTIVIASLAAALLFGLGYSIHLNEQRADAARLECIKMKRIWMHSAGACVASE